MNVIVVKGQGQVKVQPDTMAIGIVVESRAPSYSEAYDQMNANHGLIMDVFRNLKMNRSLIRLSSLRSYTNHNQNGEKQVVVSQDLTYKDKINIEQGRLLLHELRSATDFEIQVDFYLKDKTRAEDEALVLAVNNATDKAKIMASASGVKLGQVLKMVAEDALEPVTMRASLGTPSNESAKNVRINQSVEITWALDKK